MVNKKDLNKIFDEWLFSEKEVRVKYNPFIVMFKKIFKNLPKVKFPEIIGESLNEKKVKQILEQMKRNDKIISN